MSRKVGYLFSNERDLDSALLAGRIARGTDTTGGSLPGSLSTRTVFAKVDSGESGFDVEATEVIWDSSLNSGDGDFDAPTGTAWRFNTTANDAGEDYTTTNLRSTTSLAADDVVEVILYGDKSETTQWLARPSGGGGSLVYATSPNTQLNILYTYGASFDEPAGTGTALGDTALFYLSTPWNTRITAPTRLFAWWNKVGDNYYLPVTTFYVKITQQYPTATGATAFTAYYNDSATFSLGTNTAFPSGVEVKLNGFSNGSASSDIRDYFNGQTFIASYDSQNNIVYITFPRY